MVRALVKEFTEWPAKQSNAWIVGTTAGRPFGMNERKVMNGRRIQMRFIFRFMPTPSACSNFLQLFLNEILHNELRSMFDCTQKELLRIKNIWLHSKLFEEVRKKFELSYEYHFYVLCTIFRYKWEAYFIQKSAF